MENCNHSIINTNQMNQSIFSDTGIGSTELGDISTHQSNQCTFLNNTLNTSEIPPSNEQRIVWSGALNRQISQANSIVSSSNNPIAQNETSNGSESMIIRDIGQQSYGAAHEELNISLCQQSTASIPDNVTETSSIINNDQILDDINDIISPNNENSPNQNGFQELELFFNSCLNNVDIELVTNAMTVADNNITTANAEDDGSRPIKLEKGLLTNEK